MSVRFEMDAGVAVGELVEVIRMSIPSDLVRYTIYGAQGIESFISAQLSEPLGDTSFCMLLEGSQVVAASEFRRLPGGAFLNYIAVRPERSGEGLGTRLLLEAVRALKLGSQQTLSLDVFTNNVAARRWYARMGFESMAGTTWYLAKTRGDAEPYPVAGLPFANACHKAFGFSQLQAVTPGGLVNLGRLAESAFRVAGLHCLEDPRLIATCFALDPNRDLLMLETSEAIPKATGLTPIASSARLRVEVAQLMRFEATQN